jgi:hypothetical protein
MLDECTEMELNNREREGTQYQLSFFVCMPFTLWERFLDFLGLQIWHVMVLFSVELPHRLRVPAYQDC